MTRINNHSVLFNVKVIYFRVSILRRLVTVFIIFKILINNSVVDNFMNSLYLILLKEFISINNYISVYKGGEFYY